MKYPSVLLTVVAVWLIVDILAVSLGNRPLILNLYLATVVFSAVIFMIGFWRNK